MQEITVKVSNLTKKYGQKIVVENISFDVYKGEVLGFLGPNGAGKTTTIEMILGLVDITKGDVEIFGQKVRYPLSEDFKKRNFSVDKLH